MKPVTAVRHSQQGAALVLLLIALILAGSYAFYRAANRPPDATVQQIRLTESLANAKEALIAYAVTHSVQPGRMPCPDVAGDGVSPLLTRDDCAGWNSGGPDVYFGWLPWKSLGLADPFDDTGVRFRYATSRFFAGDRKTPPLNSESATSLRLDVAAGQPSNDIVAVIIATRGDADPRNADGDEYFYSGSGRESGSNDLIVAISRQELMAAVGKRITREVWNCMEQHAQHADNPGRLYPWPAPLSSTAYAGSTGSLFGRIPTTQPGNPDEALKQSIQRLADAGNALQTATDADAQLAAIKQLEKAAMYAGGLADSLFTVARDLNFAAKATSTRFAALDSSLSAITINATIYATRKTEIPAIVSDASDELEAFRSALAASGFDVFIIELEKQNALLRSAIDSAVAGPTSSTLGALQTQANKVKRDVLESAYTPDPALSQLLVAIATQAQTAVDDARTAKNAPTDQALVDAAIASANSLYDADRTLAATIRSSRLDIDPEEAAFYARNIRSAAGDFSVSGDADSAKALETALSSALGMTTSIARASPTVLAARDQAASAIDAAVRAASPLDPSALNSLSAGAASRLDALAAAMRNNGDNFLLETLKWVAGAFTDASTIPPANVTSGRLLLAKVADVKEWADITTPYADDIARLARRGATAGGDSDDSAYTAARRTVDSIDGSTGSMAQLEAYIKSPTDTAKRDAALAAVNDTRLNADKLSATSRQLESLLESGFGQAATATAWLGEACTFLQPAIGGSIVKWWPVNAWVQTTFYQISDHRRMVPGRLRVNGSGAYPLVVLAAGPPLATQNRAASTVAGYLEDANADGSRNGNAVSPATSFVNQPVSATFNDRLSY